ncbi:CRE-UNC-84 protein [Caenorhabditis remanei]|uniref:CRE-UNC-84 protein n=1 Tax=Caenorhabditis remanei TaxID=31234 RepID=E3ME00_CAERE|nr:CRE-UNC-84 protein [Caenorhabditis remanei]
MPPSIDNDFDTHEWKSEFASTQSGRSSPNIFAKVRRKLLLTPPVRNARSPRLTEEELDALTGDLKIYDPSLPDHWEVPNLAGGTSPGTLAQQEHYSAASLSRQLLYILRFPVYLILHVITYILEAFYHVIKIATFTLWDYFLYLIKIVKLRYARYQENRYRTALIRNRQDPFRVKVANFFYRFCEIIWLIVTTPYRMLTNGNGGVGQYDYKSIKNQLETERASRVTTRSQALEKSRTFAGLSRSPARRVTPITTTSTITRITARVFSSSPFGAGESSSGTGTPTVITTKTIKERSVTPRFKSTRGILKVDGLQKAFDTPEIDTPLSQYGLRSRASHVHTPEPTFDIGDLAATSTPLVPRGINKLDYIWESRDEERSTLQTLLSWIGYIILFPFYAARHIWYTIFDYGKSAYMKVTNYQQMPMEAIHVRDIDEPAPSYVDNAGVLTTSWSASIYNFFASFFSAIKESHQIVFAMLTGAVQDTTSYVGGLFSGLTNKNSSKFNWCQILGLLLALLLALFLFGFLTSDNTAIRVQKLEKEANDSKSPDGELPAVPVWLNGVNHAKHYMWMAKEYVYDMAFDSYNVIKPIVGRTATAPKYAWGLLASGCGAVTKFLGSVVTGAERFAGSLWYFLTGNFASAYESIGGFANGVYNSTSNGIGWIAKNTKNLVVNGISGIYNFFSWMFTRLLNFSTNSQTAVVSAFKSARDGSANFFYNYIYTPIAGCFTYLTGNYQNLLKPVWSALRWTYDSTVFVIQKIVEWACFLVTYPIGLITRGWVKISQYAPEDVVQVIPIPQAVTPTPEIEITKEQQEVKILKKKPEVEDEEQELVIIPAPAPEPIPLPVPPRDPVVIHQTNVVETVDKEAIIKEVSDKLRAELSAQLSAQFQQDLTEKIEQNYNTIINKLKVENNNMQYDNNHLEAIIRQLIYEYDTDKTGQVDYALESSGGAVISTRCSETYKSYTRLEKFWNIPIYYHEYSPRVVIQRNSKSLFPGECWCFKDGRGYIAVELSHYIDVSSISYEHIGKEVAPEGNRSSAPRGVLVWAYKQIDDLESRVLIGDYTYDLDGPPLQFFLAKHKPNFPVKFVELEVTSNYGAPFTCLYRLRVHGKMLKV